MLGESITAVFKLFIAVVAVVELPPRFVVCFSRESNVFLNEGTDLTPALGVSGCGHIDKKCEEGRRIDAKPWTSISGFFIQLCHYGDAKGHC